jgi:RNA polymerase sigma factor (sigma-70 family)
MATNPMNELIQHLRGTLLPQDGGKLTDGQLLEDYIAGRDEASLAALVQRHGPMVWGVCRRVLGNYHDTEDAFQATFLVFVRKATSIVPREMVVNWLYGVAHLTALKARATVITRKGRERQVAELPELAVAGQAHWDELQPVLDEELSRLSDKYRAVVVLCDLEGKTRKEAARQLGVAEGTVAGWIARARGVLAKRLVRRGITLSSGALATILSQNAAAGVPNFVLSNTIKAANLFAAGQAAATGLISVRAAALTEGVLNTMFLTKLKVVVLCVVAGLIAATGLIYQTQAAEQPKAPQTIQRPKAPKSEEPDKENRSKEDLDKLQGTWRVVAVENDGVRFSGGRPEFEDTRIVFEKSGVTFFSKTFSSITSGDPKVKNVPTGDLKMVGIPTLDAKKNPKEITFNWENKEFKYRRGIYAMDGDSLKICLSQDETAKTLPTEFSADFGSKQWLLILKRGPAPEKKDEKKP